jgi:AraC-like DNA-binding protein
MIYPGDLDDGNAIPPSGEACLLGREGPAVQRDQGDDAADESLSAFMNRVESHIKSWVESEWIAKQRIAADAARDRKPEAITALDLRKATLSVDTLASGLNGMSETALRRQLQQGGAELSPGEMIHRARMQFAARLLREGRYTIAAVAAMAGFDDQRYFASRFREQFGKSPRQYRKADTLSNSA